MGFELLYELSFIKMEIPNSAISQQDRITFHDVYAPVDACKSEARMESRALNISTS